MTHYKVKIFTKDNCAYCVKAKNWLDTHNIQYEQFKIVDEETKKVFLQTVGENVRTVPQIYLNDVRIGGYTELMNNTHLFLEKN